VVLRRQYSVVLRRQYSVVLRRQYSAVLRRQYSVVLRRQYSAVLRRQYNTPAMNQISMREGAVGVCMMVVGTREWLLNRSIQLVRAVWAGGGWSGVPYRSGAVGRSVHGLVAKGG
jgi:hypothetical protein